MSDKPCDRGYRSSHGMQRMWEDLVDFRHAAKLSTEEFEHIVITEKIIKRIKEKKQVDDYSAGCNKIIEELLAPVADRLREILNKHEDAICGRDKTGAMPPKATIATCCTPDGLRRMMTDLLDLAYALSNKDQINTIIAAQNIVYERATGHKP